MHPSPSPATEVRELDRRAIEGFGVPGVVLMENAGRGCAELLMRLNPDRSRRVILCGPGNNGGDGFVIARHLDNHGWPVGSCTCSRAGPRRSEPPTHPSNPHRVRIIPYTEVPAGAPTGTTRHSFNGSVDRYRRLDCGRPVRHRPVASARIAVRLARGERERVRQARPRRRYPVRASTATPANRSGRPCGRRTPPRSSPPSGVPQPRVPRVDRRGSRVDIGAPRVLVEEYRRRGES